MMVWWSVHAVSFVAFCWLVVHDRLPPPAGGDADS